MSKLTIAIPFFNRLHQSKGIMGYLKMMTSEDVEWLIIDNGSHEDVEGFFRNYLKPKRLNFVRNEKNVGLVRTYQQIYELCETELLCYLHNDVFIYEKNWDERVIQKFEEIKDLGVVGFFGSQGCGPIGERIQDVEYENQMAGVSNMLEAEMHGLRMKEEFRPASIFDGFAMTFRKEVLDKAGGIDQDYYLHHLYDRELSLVSLSLGYKNIVLNVACHHTTGMTTGHPDYGNWLSPTLKKDLNLEMEDAGKMDKLLHDKNTELFKNKWAHALPIYIENDFSFRSQEPFKGKKIVK